MSIYSLYFSPTGGTKKVMDIISSELKAENYIDISLPDIDMTQYQLKKDDICLIGVPSFGGRVPDIALQHLKKLRGEQTAAIIVAVYGNRAYDDTLLELQKELKTCGFHIIAAIAAVAEHSIMHQFGNGRPDAKDEQDLKKFAEKIKKLIENREAQKEQKEIKFPGNFPYRSYNGVPFKPSANKKCNRCNLCVKKCPAKAISSDNPFSVDAKKCISCMRCVSICPQQARSINKFLLSIASKKMQKACSSRKENELFI